MFLRRALFSNLRTYATEAASAGKLRLSFVCPHQALIKDQVVDQVNLSSSEGDMGILANHVPSIIQLRPGLIEVYTNGTASSASATKKSFFVSGGFATVNPDSSMQIAAMEAVPLEQLDAQMVSEGLAESQKKLQVTANAANNDVNKIEAQIHNEVFQAMNNAMAKK